MRNIGIEMCERYLPSSLFAVIGVGVYGSRITSNISPCGPPDGCMPRDAKKRGRRN